MTATDGDEHDDEGVRVLRAGDHPVGDVAERRFAPRSGDVPPQPDVPEGAVRFGGVEGGPAPTLRTAAAVPAAPRTDQEVPMTSFDPDAGLGGEEPIDVGPPTGPVRLPDWTDPPTGQVPKVVLGDDTWSEGGATGPVWRGERDDWEGADFDDGVLAAGERMGALDSSRDEAPDMFSFEEDLPSGPTPIVIGAAPDEPVVTGPASGSQPAVAQVRTRREPDDEPAPAASTAGFGGRDMPMAVAVGGGMAVLAGAAFFQLEPFGPFLVALAVVTLCAGELFGAFTRAGTRPATPVGLVAVAGLMVAAYAKGPQAVPAVLGISLIASMAWFLAKVSTGRPLLGIGTTMLGVVWVGVMGSFASSMLTRGIGRSGTIILFGAILCTVASDVGGLVAGSMFGRAPLAPDVSPNKTIEGTLGGLALSAMVGLVLGVTSDVWDGPVHGIALGLVAGILGPLGDLCQSLVKRDLGVKDMGSALPGHGGFLDRFDSLLFVLPGVYYLATAFELFRIGA